MSTAVVSILLYSLAYGARRMLAASTNQEFPHSLMFIFLTITYISLSCLLFSTSFHPSFLLISILILSIAALVQLKCSRFMLEWIHQTTFSRLWPNPEVICPSSRDSVLLIEHQQYSHCTRLLEDTPTSDDGCKYLCFCTRLSSTKVKEENNCVMQIR
ncbi:hypothetical protein Droror1_Dr00000039 [Drosera rotundifolia]